MDSPYLLLYVLLAVLVIYVSFISLLVVQRRRARRKALRLALLRQHANQAWERLRGSAAGAP